MKNYTESKELLHMFSYVTKKSKGKGVSMRKVLVYSILCFAAVMMIAPVSAEAWVTGQCATCHTMHSSQNGTITGVRGGFAPSVGQGFNACLECHSERRGYLLKLDCIGCHAENVTGASNISSITGAPQVVHNGSDLAAGNFRYAVDLGGDEYNRGHTVHGFQTSIGLYSDFYFLLQPPPGYDAGYDPSVFKFDPSYAPLADPNIFCAGANGCHGNRDIRESGGSLQGAHHADDRALKFGTINEGAQGATVGTSYRFLLGVHGGEDPDWESTVNPGKHNEYKGVAFANRAAPRNWANIVTISDFCAECHGAFHASAGVGTGTSPWLRHPTDHIIPNSGEYAAYTNWNVNVPVARQNIPNAASNVVAPGSDVVMCISCHRAHASPYPDALRWDYSAMAAGTGCFVCHTDKD
ncbi:MAG: cytochrome c [Thermodesulfovibrionales bacterium]